MVNNNFGRQRVIVFLLDIFIAEMDDLLRENSRLQKSIEGMLKEIENQKDANAQHENEIGTLLTFNERLLQIIDKEINNANKDNVSLQPISERSERESDLHVPTASIIKPRRFDNARSERGAPTSHSLIDRVHLSGTKLDIFKIELQNSEMNYDGGESEWQHQHQQHQEQSPQSSRKQFQPVLQETDRVKSQMSREIRELRDFRSQTNQFYNNKIQEVRALGSKMTKYAPREQLSQITAKLNLSSFTCSLLRKVVGKDNQ